MYISGKKIGKMIVCGIAGQGRGLDFLTKF
jgi:hypothetical protein